MFRMFHKWREIPKYQKENAVLLHYERKAVVDMDSIKKGIEGKMNPLENIMMEYI